MSSSSNKIHPIYVALDANQYSRAIKLCMALPKENLLAQALLAHAYNKSNQRYKAILVLQSIVGTDGFQELQLECKYAKEAWDQQQAANNATPIAQQQSVPKKGKKGKKKPSAIAATAAQSKPISSAVEAKGSDQWSLAKHLESPPAIDENWDKLPPAKDAITDETILGTLVITLQNLKLFLTSYQLYCWAASQIAFDVFLRKAFVHGLGVVVSPQYTAISKDILANMQVLALQLSRFNQEAGSSTRLPTSWAAQIALWQLKLATLPPDRSLDLKSDTEEEDKNEQQRLALLPRLAENLASKCVGDPIEGELASARREVYFLFLRTLEYQSKWQEMLDLLQSEVFKASDDTGVSIAPQQQVLEKQAEYMQKLEMFKEARLVFEALLKDYPDNFTYWKGHLDCSLAEHGKDKSGFRQTQDLADRVVEEGKDDKYPKRGPRLMLVELATRQIQYLSKTEESVTALNVDATIEAIQEYGGVFCSRVSCAFDDLEFYIGTILKHCSEEQVERILKWLLELRVSPESEDATERRKQQRCYIFSVKMAHKIFAEREGLAEEWLPNWQELVRTWKKTHTTDEPIQKESLPGDDLILLAIQQILRKEPTDKEFFVAAVLVEAGIKNSPSNATLKIAALDIYSRLNAASRSWEIYQELQIKHIQLDTCTFLILPILLSGGFYQEILKVSKGLLMLHTSVVREACEFMGRAMDNGILSKADEFMFFQREKMTKSLTALEATGLILDSAPFFAHEVKDASLGIAHGIVGGESDFDRATDMVIEVRNPYGALSLLERALKTTNFGDISDNRDLSILSFEFLYRRNTASREDIINDSLRRGHNHSILIRSALCVHFTKGPKKGKIVKPGEELAKCCQVLLDGVKSARQFCSTLTQPVHARLMDAQLDLCHTILVVISGSGLCDDVDDTLDEREKQAIISLQKSLSLIKDATQCSKFLEGRTDVAFVCRLLPQSVVPLFATFRMCAETLETFGWGKRKLKTKLISAEFAKVATEFSVFIKAMKAAFSCQSKTLLDDTSAALQEVSDVIEEAVVAQTRARIALGRQETLSRVRPHLDNIISFLDGFEHAIDG